MVEAGGLIVSGHIGFTSPGEEVVVSGALLLTENGDALLLVEGGDELLLVEEP